MTSPLHNLTSCLNIHLFAPESLPNVVLKSAVPLINNVNWDGSDVIQSTKIS